MTTAFSPRFDVANPFLEPHARAALAEPGASALALVRSGPPVPEHEVESTLDAIEVTVRWGAQVLAVKHLPRGEAFWVGEGSVVALPDEALGAARAPIVVRDRAGGAYVVVPPNAKGRVQPPGAAPEPIATLLMRGALPETHEINGAHALALASGAKVTLEIGAVTFEIASVHAGKVIPLDLMTSLASSALGFIGLSALGHAAIVASMAIFMPAMNADDTEAMDREQLVMMHKYLDAAAERERAQEQELAPAHEAGGPSGGGAGAPHHGESGAAGRAEPRMPKGHMAFKGDDAERALRPVDAREEAATFGIIPMLAGAADPDAPSSPWAKAYAGMDDLSARGALFGDAIGEVAGTGLALSGTGEGGGGDADVIGLGGVHTVGGGGGHGTWGIGDRDGMGIGHGPGHGGHQVKPVTLRTLSLSSNGRLPAEVIQRIVRQNFGRFRLCYQRALRSNPGLVGRVTTKFVIGRDGSVANAQDAGSDLPDQGAVSCIVRSFESLSFPPPEGGVATVVYPILLTPGG